LLSTVEELVRFSGSKAFIKSFREGLKVTFFQRGSNNSGQFLKVAVYAGGGRRGLILISKERDGWGWSRFAAELSNGKGFFQIHGGFFRRIVGFTVWCPLSEEEERWVRAGCGRSWWGEALWGCGAPLYAKVVYFVGSSSDKKLPVVYRILGQEADPTLPMRGPDSALMEVRSAVNCYDLEMHLLDPLGKFKPKVFICNPLGKDPSDAQRWSSVQGNVACPDGDADFGADDLQRKEKLLSLLVAWICYLVRLKASIGLALGVFWKAWRALGLGLL